jgi:adenosylmethionine---8-amino-7-oxononanoate aminotransferase
LVRLDRCYIWHPFTQMRDWLRGDPTVIVSGDGPYVQDAKGKRYLDANSSIWTNLHGHRHPRITRAIRRQLGKIAHSSALGLANEPASLLAEKLVKLAPRSLKKVFYSDDGSTAIEVALKMAFQRTQSLKAKPKSYISLTNAYHGDTVGAMSVSGIDAFHGAYAPLMFRSEKVMAPYCYRCPYNRAKPERADARSYRKCNWECMSLLEEKISQKKSHVAAVIEPLIQGAAGMIAHPSGYLKKFATLCRQAKIPLILDEVMTGFGRTGTMFACEQEKVQPDLMCLSKGITGGYLPLAATLTSQAVFNSFLGDYADRKTFFHGHSYTANQLGCSAALANLETFEKEKALQKVKARSAELEGLLQRFWDLKQVGDIRHVGLIAGIELVRDWRTRKPYKWEERVGIRVCDEAKKRGVLTRPIGNVLVIMPPYCATATQLEKICDVLRASISKVCS